VNVLRACYGSRSMAGMRVSRVGPRDRACGEVRFNTEVAESSEGAEKGDNARRAFTIDLRVLGELRDLRVKADH